MFVLSCKDEAIHELVISNAFLFNTQTGEVEKGMAIIIDNGVVTGIHEDGYSVAAHQNIDAGGRLVVPGFIETVGHLDDVFGDAFNAVGVSPDSIIFQRKELSAVYLPHGVTMVRTSGDCEHYLQTALWWMKNRDAGSPDLYTSGGALTHAYDGPAYINHVKVKDSAEAANKVEWYYRQGIRHIKVYGNIEYSNLEGILPKVRASGLMLSIQAQFQTSIDSCLTLGIKHFEHASTLCYESTVMDFFNDTVFNATLDKHWNTANGDRMVEGSRLFPFLEAANHIGRDNPRAMALIKKMKKHDASMTTSLHFFAQWFGLTYFASTPKAPRFVTANFTSEQKQRCIHGYKILAGYVKRMHDEGVMLAIGIDHKDGGKAMLSEMLLLNEAGIPMKDVLRIATINGARMLHLDSLYGSIEPGKRANLVIFEKDPLEEPLNLLSRKIVIKDGVVYVESGSK